MKKNTSGNEDIKKNTSENENIKKNATTNEKDITPLSPDKTPELSLNKPIPP